MIARLVEVGVLPAVKPHRKDTIHGLLARMNKQRAPLEHLPLNLNWYEEDTHGDAPPRGGHELVLTLDGGVECIAWTCKEMQAELRVLHPMLFGSLLYHLSVASATSYPVYTARDALEDDQLYMSPREYWQDIRETLKDELGRAPTRQELIQQAAEQGKSPGEMLRRLGREEWLPALSARHRLSIEEMQATCAAHATRRPAAKRTLEVTQQIAELYRVSDALRQVTTDEDTQARRSHGEQRINPVVILSGRDTGSASHLNAVQEQLEEMHQMAAQSEGFYENLLVRIHTEEDADRAAEILKLHARAWRLVQEITTVLIDGDE